TKDVDDLKFKHIYLHDITNRIEGEQKIKNYKDNLRELRTKLESVNEELKQKIGKELHDSVGHSLSLLKIQLQNVLETKELNTDEDEIKKVFISIDELSQEVRELSHELRPRILEEFGLIQAIASLIDRTNLQGNMKGYIVQNKEFRITEKKLEKNIYRICQEALNNIIKHSECSEFYLEFNLDNSILDIVISDNGKGFDLNEQFGNERSSLGLFNMKEGVEAVGGKFNIDSIKDIGTNISLKFKIIEEEND
ncbi:MAG: sensor histidine kinase, partial [Ignavibacteriae bacterium]|nr:sensor histidine kinase [Ignavibacteriota bacterium]